MWQIFVQFYLTSIWLQCQVLWIFVLEWAISLNQRSSCSVASEFTHPKSPCMYMYTRVSRLYAGVMMDHSLWRWPNIKPALDHCLCLLMGCLVLSLSPDINHGLQHYPHIHGYPANTRHWINVDLMLTQSRRRWANIKSTLIQCLVIPG